MANIIISFRKNDTKAVAGRVGDYLGNQFGETQVVVGVASLIQPGDDFIEAIEEGVKRCQALVLLIGANWVGTEGWLNNASDHDHIALTAALGANKRVIPILVEGATLPADALMGNFASLTRRQPLTLTEDTFRVDMANVANALRKVVTATAAAVPTVPPVSTGFMPQAQNISGPTMTDSYASTNPQSAPASPYSYAPQGHYGEKPKHDGEPFTPSTGESIESFNAISDVFRSPNWFLSAIIGLLINLLPLIGQIFFLGYCVRLADHKRHDGQGLPSWNDWGGDFSRGIALFVASVIYGFIFAFVQIIPLLGQLLLLLLSPVLVIALSFYLKTGTFGALFDFGGIFAFVSANTNKVLMLAIDCLILGVLSTILIAIGFALFIVPGFFVGMVVSFAFFVLAGRWAKRIVGV